MFLVRSVCHELRPPIATLTALVRALEQDQPEPRRGELARLAAEHAAYAQAILGQAASAATGLAAAPATAVPLADTLPGVAATAPSERLGLLVSRAAGQWPVHPEHTRQILINLIGNATRHSTGPVRLVARRWGRRLRLAVIDPGAPTPALMSALNRRTPPLTDRGLGLWVVRQLVAARGGTIRARAMSPAGLCVEVGLPRYRR
ncbi:sensor histidine kinase [Actinoplanes sp. NEAU-A11]|uniref:histidine kinase n=2 Tax=Actinoplanes aureus TaxID=2792083 RepID=A0A931C609_9ACTN|nr:sensor histidine kinase [Actinoplanes aureus]